MNYKSHVTHHKGKPLREMNREELIEALQYYSELYTEAREQQQNQLRKQNLFAGEIF